MNTGILALSTVYTASATVKLTSSKDRQESTANSYTDSHQESKSGGTRDTSWNYLLGSGSYNSTAYSKSKGNLEQTGATSIESNWNSESSLTVKEEYAAGGGTRTVNGSLSSETHTTETSTTTGTSVTQTDSQSEGHTTEKSTLLAGGAMEYQKLDVLSEGKTTIETTSDAPDYHFHELVTSHTKNGVKLKDGGVVTIMGMIHESHSEQRTFISDAMGGGTWMITNSDNGPTGGFDEMPLPGSATWQYPPDFFAGIEWAATAFDVTLEELQNSGLTIRDAISVGVGAAAMGAGAAIDSYLNDLSVSGAYLGYSAVSGAQSGAQKNSGEDIGIVGSLFNAIFGPYIRIGFDVYYGNYEKELDISSKIKERDIELQSRDSVHEDDLRNSIRKQAQHPIGESLNHLMQTAMVEVAGMYGTGGPGRFPMGGSDVFEKMGRSSRHLDGALGAAGKRFGSVADDMASGSNIGRHFDDCFTRGTGCFVYDTEVARGWDFVEPPRDAAPAWDATWLTAGLTLAAGTGVALIVAEPRPSTARRGSRHRGTAAPTFIPVTGDEPQPEPVTDESRQSLSATAASATDQLFAECDTLSLSTPAVPTMPIPQPPFPTAPPRRSWWAVPLLLLSALCLWNAVPGSTSPATPLAAATPSATTHSGGITKRLRTTPIGEIRLGMRVLAENPELAGQHLPDTPIDPASWRTIALTMTKPDGGRLDMEFIRSPEWMEETGARVVGDVIPLDLPELDISGPATVTAVGPCPTLEKGEGRLVTGRFVHEAAEVLNLYVEGLEKPIGTTPNHLFWSEDRKEFVAAGQLRTSELLKCSDGIHRTVTSAHRVPAAQVFNLEIDQEHVYGVGNVGIVVHNTYPGGTAPNRVSRFGEVGPSTHRQTGIVFPAEGATELPLSKIEPLHPVPRSVKPEGYIDELADTLRGGFDRSKGTADVFRMPDGTYRMANGNHRAEAMKRLGEVTIPSRVLDWKDNPAEAHKWFRERFPDLNWF